MKGLSGIRSACNELSGIGAFDDDGRVSLDDRARVVIFNVNAIRTRSPSRHDPLRRRTRIRHPRRLVRQIEVVPQVERIRDGVARAHSPRRVQHAAIELPRSRAIAGKAQRVAFGSMGIDAALHVDRSRKARRTCNARRISHDAVLALREQQRGYDRLLPADFPRRAWPGIRPDVNALVELERHSVVYPRIEDLGILEARIERSFLAEPLDDLLVQLAALVDLDAP